MQISYFRFSIFYDKKNLYDMPQFSSPRRPTLWSGLFLLYISYTLLYVTRFLVLFVNKNGILFIMLDLKSKDIYIVVVSMLLIVLYPERMKLYISVTLKTKLSIMHKHTKKKILNTMYNVRENKFN